jgi:acyl dehydratase
VTQDSLITPAMQQALGSVVATEVADVERGAIRRFAEAIEDPNPLYVDESAAHASGYRDVIAPPTFFRSLRTATPSMPDEAKVPRLLDGGSAWEYFEPVCAGDHITLVTTVESLTERAGRLGKMLFIVYTTEYSNQDGRPVAVQRNTIIRY